MKFIRNTEGGVSIEFALLAALILVPLTVGLIDTARLIQNKNVLNRAAREGAITAMHGESYTIAIEKVLTDAGMEPASLTTTVEVTSDATGDTKTLNLTYTIPDFPYFGYAGMVFPNPIHATATFQKP